MDEIEQLMMVERVFRIAAGPAAETQVCDGFTKPAVRERCKLISERRHLGWNTERRASNTATERACLASLGVVESAPPDSPFGMALAATQSPSRRDLDAKLAICGCLQSEVLRDECRFGLAESLSRRGDLDAATRTCTACRPLITSICVEHVARLGPLHVALDDASDPRWDALEAMTKHLAQRKSRGTIEEDLADYLWNATIHASIERALASTGGELTLDPGLAERLPPFATAHLRSAAAWAAVAMTAEADPERAALRTLAQDLLAGTTPVRGLGAAPQWGAPEACGMVEHERGDRTPRTHFLDGLPRTRPVAKTAEEDLELALDAAEACQGRVVRPGP